MSADRSAPNDMILEVDDAHLWIEQEYSPHQGLGSEGDDTVGDDAPAQGAEQQVLP